MGINRPAGDPFYSFMCSFNPYLRKMAINRPAGDPFYSFMCSFNLSGHTPSCFNPYLRKMGINRPACDPFYSFMCSFNPYLRKNGHKPTGVCWASPPELFQSLP